MKILVSACLLGENCKYNGKNNYSERVAKYLEGHEVIRYVLRCWEDFRPRGIRRRS